MPRTKKNKTNLDLEKNLFSKGVATELAIVSGLAPGNTAFTTIVGKSTSGNWLTGNK